MPNTSLIYIVLLSVNIVTLLSKAYHRWRVPFRFLLVILCGAFTLELLTSYIFSDMPNNLIFYHINNPIEFALYSMFFRSLNMSVKINRMIGLMIPIYILAAIILSTYVQVTNVSNSYETILESIILIFYSLLYLRHLNVLEIETKAERNPYFWITLGILFYFTGAFFMEGFLNILLKISEDKARIYYKISFLFKYAMCLFFLAGILVKKNDYNNI